jgi:hypothetical protein
MILFKLKLHMVSDHMSCFILKSALACRAPFFTPTSTSISTGTTNNQFKNSEPEFWLKLEENDPTKWQVTRSVAIWMLGLKHCIEFRYSHHTHIYTYNTSTSKLLCHWVLGARVIFDCGVKIYMLMAFYFTGGGWEWAR